MLESSINVPMKRKSKEKGREENLGVADKGQKIGTASFAGGGGWYG